MASLYACSNVPSSVDLKHSRIASRHFTVERLTESAPEEVLMHEWECFRACPARQDERCKVLLDEDHEARSPENLYMMGSLADERDSGVR